ncbi:GNAT family N-acetyltransferase [Rhodopseudomonas pseudopalustris]|uniref:Acetyltransferase (GNAT) domain-containing protein n=1 Tax=Rhodopseudomonas pseudopalustris TaxID=1513892 RepID=A0A1H8WII4_9BRAD|nr:GNAT family N-acetyltransferase [Rhodopseudomonas pseudopalustris]SEP27494.1 Acetyltransferase (GNAT) domain-containing protein [Rhodopseudomonas pseudopalustris]
MFVRLPLEEELGTFVELARMAMAESYPDEPFSEQAAAATFRRYLDTAAPTFFFCDDRGRVAGVLQATISAFDFSDGIFTTLCGTFVHPDYRGTRAAALLIAEFCRWSDRLGAVKSTGGNDNRLTTERTTRLLGHFGFERVGAFVTRKRGA